MEARHEFCEASGQWQYAAILAKPGVGLPSDAVDTAAFLPGRAKIDTGSLYALPVLKHHAAIDPSRPIIHLLTSIWIVTRLALTGLQRKLRLSRLRYSPGRSNL